jgi:hypothetical protein
MPDFRNSLASLGYPLRSPRVSNGEIVGIDSSLVSALLSLAVPWCERVRGRLQPYRNETVCLHVSLKQGFLLRELLVPLIISVDSGY